MWHHKTQMISLQIERSGGQSQMCKEVEKRKVLISTKLKGTEITKSIGESLGGN